MKKKPPIADESLESFIYSSRIAGLAEMAGGVAHEINTPLATLMLIAGQCADILNSPDPDLELLKKKISKIDLVTLRIAGIVAAMRSFSRDGQYDNIASCKVSDIIETALSFSRERLASRGIVLHVAPFDPELSVCVRAAEISQVLLILLHNSQDALESLSPPKWIKIQAQPQGEQVELSIEDAGCGIAPENQNRVFDPFYTTKGASQKIGLSLSVAKRIIESQGGSIALDTSSPNTRFVIKLPR